MTLKTRTRPVSEQRNLSGPGFVLELDGQPIFAFSAPTMKSALALCTRNWLSHELSRFHSFGRPLWRDGMCIAVRHANPRETAELQIARAKEIAAREFDGDTIVFLVPLDPALQ